MIFSILIHTKLCKKNKVGRNGVPSYTLWSKSTGTFPTNSKTIQGNSSKYYFEKMCQTTKEVLLKPL